MACSTCGKSPFSQQQQLVINQTQNQPTIYYGENPNKVKAIRGVIIVPPVPYPLPPGPVPNSEPSTDKE